MNPSNDWLPYKNDEIDKGEEDDEGESAPTGHKAFPHGSKHYGHVQTRNTIYHDQLGDNHLRKEIKLNEAQEKKEHRILHKLHKQLPNEIERMRRDDDENEKFKSIIQKDERKKKIKEMK